jgi:hypothetical protein
MRRGLDGRVQLRHADGRWFSVRLDMEVPGALLLRAPDGAVFAVETDGLPQARCAGGDRVRCCGG